MARTTNEVSPRRRGHGESTIYQKSDGSWEGQVSFGKKLDGSRDRRTVRGKTRSEAIKRVKELEAARTAGIQLPAKEITVEVLINRWLEEIVKPSLKQTTYRSYEQMARNHIVPALGKRKLSEIGADTVDQFLQTKLRTGPTNDTALSSQSVRYLRGLLRRAWRFAAKWGWVSGTNIITLSEPISVQRSKSVVLSGDELAVLLQTFSGCRDEALFSTALGLGLRLGEVLGLRWEDVKLDVTGGATISIRVQLQRLNGKLQLTSPKSESSKRTVYLPEFVSEALQKRREVQAQERILSGDRWDNVFGLVFANKDGGPLDPSRVRKRFKQAIADSEKDDLRLHDLRHIAASVLLGEGISVVDTAAQLGHADPHLVVRTYGHAMPQGKREAANAMNKAFSKRVTQQEM